MKSLSESGKEFFEQAKWISFEWKEDRRLLQVNLKGIPLVMGYHQFTAGEPKYFPENWQKQSRILITLPKEGQTFSIYAVLWLGIHCEMFGTNGCKIKFKIESGEPKIITWEKFDYSWQYYGDKEKALDHELSDILLTYKWNGGIQNTYLIGELVAALLKTEEKALDAEEKASIKKLAPKRTKKAVPARMPDNAVIW